MQLKETLHDQSIQIVESPVIGTLVDVFCRLDELFVGRGPPPANAHANLQHLHIPKGCSTALLNVAKFRLNRALNALKTKESVMRKFDVVKDNLDVLMDAGRAISEV